MKRYVVFERPEGSTCWTIAFKMIGEDFVPAQFPTTEKAEAWIRESHSKQWGFNGKPMTAFVAEIELPE